MSQTLCLDFGTSSLRAALLNHKGVQLVLPIGLSVHSALDDASIRSDILISSDGSKIYLAEAAIKLRSTQQYLLYDSSPKLWFNNPDNLSELIVQGSKITREMLLTALVAFALFACKTAAKFNNDKFSKLDIRMSHPIWEESVASKINHLHESILRTAIKLAPEMNDGVILTEVFVSKYLEVVNFKNNKIDKKIEVLEPIAAALTLFPNQNNISRICTVIDIGAGTTDIGIFNVIYPDDSSDIKRKLIPIGKTISLFVAGNTIDRILLDYIVAKASIKIKDDQIKEVETRIRQIKERLFTDGAIRELEMNFKLKDFIINPKLKNIYENIKTAIQDSLSDLQNYKELEPFYKNRNIHQIDIVMGGGGGSLSFITEPLKCENFNFGEHYLSTNMLKPNTELGIPLFNASPERLAVALGGSNPEYDSLITNFVNPIYFMRGPM
jgi:molecular chaperone HscA